MLNYVLWWVCSKYCMYISFTEFSLISKQDSKESSPRSLDKVLLKLQVNSQNVQNTQLSKLFKFSKSSKFSNFLKCSKFKPCQIIILKYSYDTKWCNHINSCHTKNLLNMSGLVLCELICFYRHVKTCLEILKSLMQIDTILQTY